MPKIQRNYYNEIDQALKVLESYHPYPTKDIYWVCDRIEWAWKWRKITKEQMEELADRAVAYMDGGGY